MPEQFELPNQRAFVDGPAYHYFDALSWRAWRPRRPGAGGENLRRNPLDICKSMPLDECYLATEGSGAEGTPGYLALDGDDADEFYAESAPIWWTPARLFDLRNTWATFFLKEIRPITVAPGYAPHLFIAAYMPNVRPPRTRISGWYLKETLKVGRSEWSFNQVLLTTDEDKWVNYHSTNPVEDTLERVLHQCGFIGWLYTKDKHFQGVHASGTMGWDELRFNLKTRDLNDLRDGKAIPHALVF